MTAAVRELDCDVLERDTAEVGEGPGWDESTQTLVWVDITGGSVRRTTAAGDRVATWPVGRHVGAALPTDGDELLLAVREGFALLGPDGGMEQLLEVEPDPSVRFNDAKCDPRGRAFAGTMPYEARPGAARLYRLEVGVAPRATPVIERMTLANGIAWSLDARTMWVIDSGPGTVTTYAYDPDTGELGALRGRFRPEAGEGCMPDGMCVDDDGKLWIAMWGAGEVRRYDPGGALEAVVRLPVSQVTSCCFGGPSHDILFVTSATYRLDERQLAREPLAGSVFAVSPGVTGPPATPCIMRR